MNTVKSTLAATLVLLVTVLPCAAQPSATIQQSATTSARTSPLGVGDLAPDFTLEDQQGRNVTLSSARGKRPVVIVFYRGYW